MLKSLSSHFFKHFILYRKQALPALLIAISFYFFSADHIRAQDKGDYSYEDCLWDCLGFVDDLPGKVESVYGVYPRIDVFINEVDQMRACRDGCVKLNTVFNQKIAPDKKQKQSTTKTQKNTHNSKPPSKDTSEEYICTTIRVKHGSTLSVECSPEYD